jgi:hypothetical protein
MCNQDTLLIDAAFAGDEYLARYVGSRVLTLLRREGYYGPTRVGKYRIAVGGMGPKEFQALIYSVCEGLNEGSRLGARSTLKEFDADVGGWFQDALVGTLDKLDKAR